MDATLFGFDAARWSSVAEALLTPTAGLALLYVLGLPLNKGPGGVEVRRYPSWVLPLLVFASISACGFCAAVAFTLQNSKGPPPSLSAFESHYYRESAIGPVARRKLASLVGKSISKAWVEVRKYDGFSNARVLVNNTRIFGTYYDCRFCYQCKPEASSRGAPGGHSTCVLPTKIRLNKIFYAPGARQRSSPPPNALPPAKATAQGAEIYQFLVALTRAKKRVYLVNTINCRVSNFLDAIDPQYYSVM